MSSPTEIFEKIAHPMRIRILKGLSHGFWSIEE